MMLMKSMIIITIMMRVAMMTVMLTVMVRSLKALEALFFEAQVWGRERLNPLRLLAHWSAELEASLAFEIAQVALLNLGGVPKSLDGFA